RLFSSPLFSFPTPPPPATSTLSLHDALPICALLRGRRPDQVRRLLPAGRPAQGDARLPAVARAVPLERLARQVSLRGEDVRRHRDRKSTRLNSSHDQISYAVFCLKKKKKTNI